MIIGYVGLSHLGLVYSITAASKGFEVVAFDRDEQLCLDLNMGNLPISEPGLVELLNDNRDAIEFTHDPMRLATCSLVYISLDIETDDNGESDLSIIYDLITLVLGYMDQEATMVILSQVPPGFHRTLLTKIRLDPDNSRLSLYHQVETLIFGKAVERALIPERIIVGCDQPGEPLPNVYHGFLRSFDAPLHVMTYGSAELTKAAINICLVSSISATNTLAEICESIGADWSEVVPALRSDRRIGEFAYLTPGLGLSGGNLERDVATILSLASENGTNSAVIEAYLDNSLHCQGWAFRNLHRHVLGFIEDPVVGIWGLAYKPDTDSVKNSPSLALINSLKRYSIKIYDPQASLASTDHEKIQQVGSCIESCNDCDVLVIMTAWPEFSDVNLNEVADTMVGNVIIDPFGVVDRQECQRLGIRHYQLGKPEVIP